MVAATEARLGTNRGEALARPPLDRLAGHPGGKWVRTQIDWPEDDVEYAVEILVRNRGGLERELRDSTIWTGRSQTTRKCRREILLKPSLRKRPRVLEVRQTRERTLVPPRRAGTAVRVIVRSLHELALMTRLNS
jgi:hypothetical protein